MNDKFIGQRVAALILKTGVSERKLGEKIGHYESYINKVVNGNIKPPLKKIEMICDVFGVTLQEFFAGPESLTINQYLFLSELDGLSEDDIQLLLTTARHLKKLNSASKRRKSR